MSIAATPEAIDVFERLRQHLASVHFNWRTYRQLFATNAKRIDLLNDSAPSFFWLLHRTLLDAVVLGVCHLTDKNDRTLRLRRLHAALRPSLSAEQESTVRRQIEDVEAATTALMTHRNKRLAHTEYLVKPDDVLPPLSQEMIESVLQLSRDLMHLVQGWLDRGETDYGVIAPGDAESLIGCLEDAALLHELQNDYYVRRLPDSNILNRLATANPKHVYL